MKRTRHHKFTDSLDAHKIPLEQHIYKDLTHVAAPYITPNSVGTSYPQCFTHHKLANIFLVNLQLITRAETVTNLTAANWTPIHHLPAAAAASLPGGRGDIAPGRVITLGACSG